MPETENGVATSRAETIRKYFLQQFEEGATTEEVAVALLEDGLLSDVDLERAKIRITQEYVRQALGYRDATGLPLAGPSYRFIRHGQSHWLPREKWEYEDYVYNIRRMVRMRDAYNANVQLLLKECEEKFGKTPSMEEIQRPRE